MYDLSPKFVATLFASTLIVAVVAALVVNHSEKK
jgi:hypothetical protein